MNQFLVSKNFIEFVRIQAVDSVCAEAVNLGMGIFPLFSRQSFRAIVQFLFRGER